MLSQLDLTLGALEIGAFLSSTLWGVTTVQFYVYLTTPNKDPLWTKLLVYFVWVLESIHTVFVWVYIYRLTVTFYGIPAVLAQTHWSLDISAFFDGIIGAVVQMYFAYRIRSFSKSWRVTLVSWLGSMLQLAATTAITIVSGRVTIAEFMVRYDWLVTANLCINLIVDVINTGGLTYYLRRERTSFKGTDIILKQLVLWTVETGFVTALAAAVQLILEKAMPNSALWIGISLFYAKFYSNSFLATLNSRSIIRQGLATQAQTTGVNRSWSGTQTQSGVHIRVVREQGEELELQNIKRMDDKTGDVAL